MNGNGDGRDGNDPFERIAHVRLSCPGGGASAYGDDGRGHGHGHGLATVSDGVGRSDDESFRGGCASGHHDAGLWVS